MFCVYCVYYCILSPGIEETQDAGRQLNGADPILQSAVNTTVALTKTNYLLTVLLFAIGAIHRIHFQLGRKVQANAGIYRGAA